MLVGDRRFATAPESAGAVWRARSPGGAPRRAADPRPPRPDRPGPRRGPGAEPTGATHRGTRRSARRAFGPEPHRADALELPANPYFVEQVFGIYSRQLELGGITPTGIFVCPLCRDGFTRDTLAGLDPLVSLAHQGVGVDLDERSRMTALRDKCKDTWAAPCFDAFIRQSAEIRKTEDERRPLGLGDELRSGPEPS